MRWWGRLVVLICLGWGGAAAAYTLDTPHNESNGIYCHTCHQMPEMKLSIDEWAARTLLDPDDTMKNAVCNVCHASTSSHPLKGPAKMMHASSSMASSATTWSTECVQCHDVHYQDQLLTWKTVADRNKMYLVTSNFMTANGARTYVDPNPLVEGDDYTTIGFDNSPATFKYQAGFGNPATWNCKGGDINACNMDPARAVDGSRGLILVPNKAVPSETFEIIDATANVIKVKGRMDKDVGNGGSFAIIYGQSIRAKVMPNGGIADSDIRDVKFFVPNLIAGTSGGYVDLTPAATRPIGLCQICHTEAKYWRSDGTLAQHNAGSDCDSCHDFLVGGEGKYPDHSLRISNYNSGGADCSVCHSYNADPIGEIHATAVNVATLGTGCDVCHDVAMTALNDNVAARLGVSPVFGDGWTIVTCAGCHDTKPAALLAGAHGGHPADFGKDAVCTVCHTGANVLKNIHGNGTIATCAMCHSGTTANRTNEKAGNALNGIDGDATLANGTAAASTWAAKTCVTCHTAATGANNFTSVGGIHHDNKSGNLNCTTANCHTASKLAHTTSVATDAYCSKCHDAVVANGNPRDAITAPFIGTGEIHLSKGACTACHLIDSGVGKSGGLRTGVTGITLSNNATSTWVNGTDGGGNCTTCHGVYFANHLNASATHAATRVTNSCSGCHTTVAVGAARKAVTSPFIADGDVHATYGCFTCHQVDGLLKISPAKAPGQNTSTFDGGSCIACHISGDKTWTTVHSIGTVSHATKVTINANCTYCHTATTPGASSLAKDAVSSPFIGSGEVHNGAGCATCHSAITGATLIPYGRAVAITGGGSCSTCHINATTKNWVTVHTPVSTAAHGNIIAAASCATCHGNPTPATSNARDAKVAPYIAADDVHAGGCGLCHNTSNGARIVGVSGKGSADVPASAGKWACDNCHTATWEYSHTARAGVDHSGRASALIACTGCHSATAGGSAGLMPIDPDNNKVHDACTVCHQATGVLKPGSTTYGGKTIAKGDCGTCHGSTYFDSHVHGSLTPGYVSHDISYIPSLDLSQELPGTGCAECHKPAATLSTWAGILEEHSGGCVRCHGLFNAPAPNTPLLATANAVIAASTGSHCLTCHADKATPATHGGHPVNFGTTASCTNSCHNSGPDVVANVHSNKCQLCHSGAPNRDSEKVGDPLNGIDGDATLANGTTVANSWGAKTCLTCHAAATGANNFASTGGIHHDNKSGNVTCSTANCHTASKLTHTTSVSNSCASCHDAVVGGSARDAIVSPFTGTGQVHQNNGGCTACHLIDAGVGKSGGLRTTGLPAGMTLSNGGTPTWINGTDGGGSCSTCHVSGATTWASLHSGGSVSHADKVTVSANCASCHTAITPGASALAKDAVTSPFLGSGEVHNAAGCATCHNATSGATLAPYGRAVAITAGGCSTCHINGTTNTWASLHTPNSTVEHGNITTSASCVTCHGNPTPVTSNARDAKVAPYIVAGDVHAGGCGQCHNTTNGNRIAGGKGKGRADVPATAGKWTCVTCHTATWEASHTAGTGVDHTGRVSGLTLCVSCHNNTAGGAAGLMPVSTVDNKVHDACIVCHTSNGALNSGSTTYGGKTIAKGDCGTCHGAAYFDSHVHSHAVTFSKTVDISQTGGATNSCMYCHDDASLGKGTNALSTWASIKTEHATIAGQAQASACATCHNYASVGNQSGDPETPLVATVTAALNTHTGVTCNTCHVPKSFALSPATAVHGGHNPTDFAWTAATKTSCGAANCHNYTLNTDVAMNIHGTSCGICHVNESGGGIRRGGSDADARLATSVTAACTVCHAVKATVGGMHHDTEATANNNCTTNCHQVVDHSTKIVDSSSCNAAFCHAKTNYAGSNDSAAGTQPVATLVDRNNSMKHDSCRTCHTFAASTFVGTLKSSTGQKGITAMAAGTCTSCHKQATAVFHHLNVNTKNGACSYCHNDPRNDAYSASTVYGNLPVPTGGMPKNKLICDECHVTPLANTSGWTGGMTISAWNEGGTHSTTNYSTAFTRTVAHSGGHVIPNTSGKIDNWGICFSCHDGAGEGGALTRIKPLHAQPTATPRCTPTYAPGNASAGNKGISRTYFLGKTWRPGSIGESSSGQECEQMEPTYNNANSVKNGIRGAVASLSVPDPWVTPTKMVPVPVWTGTAVPAAPASVVTPVAVDIKVTSAIWNGSSLTVKATTTGVCSNLTLVNGKGNVAFNTSCVATVAGYAYPNNGATVDVVDNTTSSVSVIGYRITSTAPPAPPVPAAAVADTATVNAVGVTNLLVMANDTGTGITITGVTQPTRGSVAIAGGGSSIDYTGNGTGGSTTFSYTIMASNGSTATATVSLTITAPATPAVAVLNGWSNKYSGVPTRSPVDAGSFAVGSGSNRVLLVAVVMEYANAANPTISATYGGAALTQIAISTSSQREAVWLGRLNDTGIGSGSKTLSVTYGGSIGTVSSMHVKWAAFSGVNQFTPIYGSTARSSSSNTVASATAVSYVANGMTVAIAANGGSPATVAVNASPTLVSGTIDTTNGQSSQTFVSAKHTGAGNYPSGGISFTWSGSTSSRSAMAAASLQPN